MTRDPDTRRAALAFFEALATSVRDGIERGELPRLTLPVRSLSNVRYDPNKGWLELAGATKGRTIGVRAVRSFAQTLRLCAFSKQLVESGDFATKREAYYVSKGWGECRFDSQVESDTILDDVEAMASLDGLSREALRFRPESHGGSVVGELVVQDVDPTTGETAVVDCRQLGSGAWTIPRSVEHLRLESKAKFVLAIETGGMFQRLANHRFWRERECVLVELGGVPTRATRRFIRRLHDECSLPVYSFTDCDPWGFANIHRTLKAGSGQSAHVNRSLCVPGARFLGVTPDDIHDFDLMDATHPLSPRDVKRARDAIERDPFFAAHPAWVAAIEKQISMGVRAEQQALAKWGLNYVIDEYLPKKLERPDSFLP